MRPAATSRASRSTYSGCRSTSHSISEPLVCSAIGSVGIVLEHVQKRPVAVLIGLLENAVEVADRLMVVEYEDQSERRAHVEESCRSNWSPRHPSSCAGSTRCVL